jgi:LPS export ABC transporter protein LptC/lipopolysaccharide transport protein LptA
MNKRNGIILGLLFLILVIEIMIFAPKETGLSVAEDAPKLGPTPAAGASGQVMQDVHSVGVKAGAKEWELWARKALRPRENEDWTIERVTVKFFADNGVFYTVTGAKGNVLQNKYDIRISGNVVTKSSNGYTFKSESVFYDSKSRHLTSPQDVEMDGPPDQSGAALKLTGTELNADFVSNKIEVNKNVRALKRIKDGKLATIQSERALFSGATNMAQFFGNVIIDFDTMRITGPEAQFAYDRKTQSVQSVLVGGGVKVTDTDKYATSSTVSVHFDDDRITFSGSPRVVQNGDELVGDEIVFLENGKKVQVSNARAQLDPKSMEKVEKPN